MDDLEMSELINLWSIRPPPQVQPQPYHPQTKVSNRRFTRAEWEDQKSKIQSLYIEEGNTLSQVQEILSQSGFNATCVFTRHYSIKFRRSNANQSSRLKQLKTKIKSWRLDKKNIKTDDMISIAQTREKRRRVGVESRFRVYGAPFDEAKIDRFLKRNNLSAEDVLDVPSPTDGEFFT
jgi:elongation factor P--beta-lysine ligase